MERSYSVRKYINGVEREVGVVRASHHTQADTKATRMFGWGVWTKEKEAALKSA